MKKEKIDLIRKSILGQGEKVQADGGSLVDKPVIEIIAPKFMNGSIYERCRIMNISNEGITLPRYDTSDATDLSFFGARAYWTEEGGNLDTTKIAFENKPLKLRKVVSTIPATNEILADVEAMISYINTIGVEAIKYQIDRALIYGNDSFAAGGVVGSAKEATIFLPAEASWATTCAKMIGSYYGGAEGCWLMSQNVFAELVLEHQNDFFLEFSAGKVYLFGYEIVVSNAAKEDTLILGDWSQYQVVQKELRSDISGHTRFDTFESVIRMVARIQGAPIWSSPVTLNDGSEVAPFVALEPMEDEEISSEEWLQSESSESSDSSESSGSSLSSDSSEGV